jgi:hypothetical protein
VKRNKEGALTLTRAETEALATFLIGCNLGDAEDWLQWEDVPYLTEGAHKRVVRAIEDHALKAHKSVKYMRRTFDVDAAVIYREVTG